MGTFEKLGILVIVAIIVMILAVAIYQWGGAGNPPTGSVVEIPGGQLTVKNLDELVRADEEAGKLSPPPSPDASAWPGGIPKRYRIAPDDNVWVLVVKRWGLKESFIQAIEKANPKIDFNRLKPGTELVVPDPSAYRRASIEKQARPRQSGAQSLDQPARCASLPALGQWT